MKSRKYLLKGTILTPFTISLIYCLFGLLWFYFADFRRYGGKPITELYKDFAFVIITSFLIFGLIKRKSSVLRGIQDHHKAVIRRVIENKEADNEYIAYNIQNNFSQELAAIKIQLTALKKRHDQNPGEFGEVLALETETISGGINKLIHGFRKFTEEIRPEALEDLDLKDSIDWLVSDHRRRTGIKTFFVSNIGEFRLEKKTAVNIFRILQEAVWSADEPGEIVLKAAEEKKAFVFTVSFFNNKKKFFAGARDETVLLSLKERIAMVEGKLAEIKSGKGLFRLSFYVPKTGRGND